MQHEVFDEAADGVVRQSGDDRGAQAKTTAQAAGDVVLTAALPSAKGPCGVNAVFTRIKTQHHLTQADTIPADALRSSCLYLVHHFLSGLLDIKAICLEIAALVHSHYKPESPSCIKVGSRHSSGF